MVLIQDRKDITPNELEYLMNEFQQDISRDVEIDRTAVRIAMGQEDHGQRLVDNIPLWVA